ncbi:hypothetical protein [Cryptosporangium phraense]|uniref:Uncharacterized protein n=1 Tax=Cryptosporangium phraense TaxID=2593070 RepID=A0A545AXZ6_9ACTN|nr:hypothetical protein [Cryptosporangium phraense]TQS46207.1 hypothetical protein FL583_06960 [Cryptosporangium phraense]
MCQELLGDGGVGAGQDPQRLDDGRGGQGRAAERRGDGDAEQPAGPDRGDSWRATRRASAEEVSSGGVSTVVIGPVR